MRAAFPRGGQMARIFVVVYGCYMLLTYRTEHAMVHAALERRRHAL